MSAKLCSRRWMPRSGAPSSRWKWCRKPAKSIVNGRAFCKEHARERIKMQAVAK